LFWGQMTELFFCVFCLLIGISWLPLGSILCPLWPSTHWWPFWIGLRFLLDFHILVGTFCKTIHFCQQKKEALYQIWCVVNAIPIYLCNINANNQSNCCAQKDQLYFQSLKNTVNCKHWILSNSSLSLCDTPV
jgi:hypothetical protein